MPINIIVLDFLKNLKHLYSIDNQNFKVFSYLC